MVSNKKLLSDPIFLVASPEDEAMKQCQKLWQHEADTLPPWYQASNRTKSLAHLLLDEGKGASLTLYGIVHASAHVLWGPIFFNVYLVEAGSASLCNNIYLHIKFETNYGPS